MFHLFTLESVCLKPNVQYGSVNCSQTDNTDNLVAVGGRCNIQCNVGYKPQNSNGTIQCLSDGLWSHQAECAQITCPPFVISSPLVNVNCNGSVFNSVCILSCRNEIVPSENFSYICGNSAEWESMDNELNCQITVSSIATTTTTAAATITTTTTTTTTTATIAASTNQVTFVTTTVSVFGSKNSANSGAIAGGVIAAILLLMGLLALVIVLVWQYKKRLAGFFSVPSTGKLTPVIFK